MMKLESASNEKIKLAVKAATSAKFRKQSGLFFLEGLRLCRDAAVTGYEIECAFFTESAQKKFPEDVDFIISKSKICYLISDNIEKKITQAQTPQGVFCLCKRKITEHKIDFKGKYIALENNYTRSEKNE